MKNILTENTLYDQSTKASFLSDKQKIIDAFFLNFFGFLGMISIDNKQPKMVAYQKSNKSLRPNKIADENTDFTLSAKLYDDIGGFVGATFPQLTKFFVKIRNGEIDSSSFDEAAIRSLMGGMRWVSTGKPSPRIYNEVKDFYDSKIDIKQLAANLYKLAKLPEFKPLTLEFRIMARKYNLKAIPSTVSVSSQPVVQAQTPTSQVKIPANKNYTPQQLANIAAGLTPTGRAKMKYGKKGVNASSNVATPQPTVQTQTQPPVVVPQPATPAVQAPNLADFYTEIFESDWKLISDVAKKYNKTSLYKNELVENRKYLSVERAIYLVARYSFYTSSEVMIPAIMEKFIDILNDESLYNSAKDNREFEIAFTNFYTGQYYKDHPTRNGVDVIVGSYFLKSERELLSKNTNAVGEYFQGLHYAAATIIIENDKTIDFNSILNILRSINKRELTEHTFRHVNFYVFNEKVEKDKTVSELGYVISKENLDTLSDSQKDMIKKYSLLEFFNIKVSNPDEIYRKLVQEMTFYQSPGEKRLEEMQANNEDFSGLSMYLQSGDSLDFDPYAITPTSIKIIKKNFVGDYRKFENKLAEVPEKFNGFQNYLTWFKHDPELYKIFPKLNESWEKNLFKASSTSFVQMFENGTDIGLNPSPDFFEKFVLSLNDRSTWTSLSFSVLEDSMILPLIQNFELPDSLLTEILNYSGHYKVPATKLIAFLAKVENSPLILKAPKLGYKEKIRNILKDNKNIQVLLTFSSNFDVDMTDEIIETLNNGTTRPFDIFQSTEDGIPFAGSKFEAELLGKYLTSPHFDLTNFNPDSWMGNAINRFFSNEHFDEIVEKYPKAISILLDGFKTMVKNLEEKSNSDSSKYMGSDVINALKNAQLMHVKKQTSAKVVESLVSLVKMGSKARKLGKPYVDPVNELISEIFIESENDMEGVFSMLETAQKKMISLRVAEGEFALTVLEHINEKALVKPRRKLDKSSALKVLKLNGISLPSEIKLDFRKLRGGVKLSDLKSLVKSQADDYKIKEQPIAEVTMSDEELEKLSIVYDEYNKGRHGNISIKIRKVFTVNQAENNVLWDQFKQRLEDDGILYRHYSTMPQFHGTSSIPASMILRYGFTILDERLARDAGIKYAGKMLGDGIYSSNVLDKVSQYIADDAASGVSRAHGSIGYIFEMSCQGSEWTRILGNGTGNYSTAGGIHGGEAFHTVSPEWAWKEPKEQMKIYKCYEIELVSKEQMRQLKRKHATVVEAIRRKVPRFKQFIFEKEMERVRQPYESVASFIFMDGYVPIKGKFVYFEDVKSSMLPKNAVITSGRYGFTVEFPSDEQISYRTLNGGNMDYRMKQAWEKFTG